MPSQLTQVAGVWDLRAVGKFQAWWSTLFRHGVPERGKDIELVVDFRLGGIRPYQCV